MRHGHGILETRGAMQRATIRRKFVVIYLFSQVVVHKI